jgi:hypothetical protein
MASGRSRVKVEATTVLHRPGFFWRLARKSMFLAPNNKHNVAIWQQVVGNRV